VYCHGGRPTPQASGTSWGSGSTACGTCHAAPPPYGKHANHNKGHQGTGSTTPTNNSGASGYDFSCYYCHYSNNHINFPANRAQRQDAQITFNGTLGVVTLSSGSSYTAGGAPNAGWDNVTNQGLSFSDGSCTVYCHSNADPSGTGGGVMTYASPSWVTGAGGSCTICHKGPDTYTNMSTGAPQMSRGHWTHLSTDRYGFTCDECHANTAAADSPNSLNTPTAYTYHVNGRKNWNGQDVKGGAGVRSTSIDDSGMTYDNVTNRTCTANYCHSDGTDDTAPFANPTARVATIPISRQVHRWRRTPTASTSPTGSPAGPATTTRCRTTRRSRLRGMPTT
jgi:predicted CxxxxCH...CXXCH cytochrome family protein